MTNTITDAGRYVQVPLGSIVVAITAASVEQTGLVPGAFYEFSACGGSAVCRWDTNAATVADGGATFCIPAGSTRIVKNPAVNTLLNVIEGDASSDAAAQLFLVEVNPV